MKLVGLWGPELETSDVAVGRMVSHTENAVTKKERKKKQEHTNVHTHKQGNKQRNNQRNI